MVVVRSIPEVEPGHPPNYRPSHAFALNHDSKQLSHLTIKYSSSIVSQETWRVQPRVCLSKEGGDISRIKTTKRESSVTMSKRSQTHDV